MIGLTNLSTLPQLREYSSHRISSWDISGGNDDRWTIQPQATRILAELQGPACIKHIWMTLGLPLEDYTRRIILRIYWDECQQPSVECPIGDFFGLGHGIRKNFISLPLQMSPEDGKGFNSWWSMPFRSYARVEVENQGIEPYHQYFYIDYEKYSSEESVSDFAYFHTQWRREANTRGWAYDQQLLKTEVKQDGAWKQLPRRERTRKFWTSAKKDPRWYNLDGMNNYVILKTNGNGIYCGAHLDIDCFTRNPNDWFGEGDDMIFIDGVQWPPSLHGTGTEDWYHCAYCPTQEYQAPYHGVILYSGTPEWPWKGKNSVYRYHIEDPIRFQKEILVTIEHGHGNKLSNDYSSTAYYYLSQPQQGGPSLPSVQNRLPRPIEAEW
jgi:hypothetical protein